MPKKLGGTDDFDPKKQNRINDFKEGRRFSFRVPGNVPQPDTECGKLEIPDYTRENKGKIGRGSGDAVLYSGEQLENYKKQYPRFEKAIDLVPDGKIKRDGNQVYLFCSKNSPTGYWEVTLLTNTPTYFIEAGEPLTIICPIPFKITQVLSNGESFKWTQLEGGRLAVVDPDNTIDPTLLILDNIRDSRPIRFEIAVEQNLSVKDTLIIYTTPTSDLDGLSYETPIAAPDAAPTRKVPCMVIPAAPLPQLLQIAYQFNSVNTQVTTWNLPLEGQEYLIETIWQQNTTGQYLDVQKFPKSSYRAFTANLNTHYRILANFNTHGHLSVSDSCRFYFTNSNKGIAGDDILDGLSFVRLKTNITKLPLARILLTAPTDTCNGISATELKNNITKLPLSGKLLKAPIDIYDGISFVKLKTSVAKIQLGGMIIT